MGKAIACILIAVLACACPLLALLLLLAFGLFNLLVWERGEIPAFPTLFL